jgi:hypothetical protein
MMAEHQAPSYPAPQGNWQGGYAPAERQDSGGLPAGLLIGGLVVVGLGLLAWYYMGPDLVRYMKIRNM